MTIVADFSVCRRDDSPLQISMTPTVPVGGWSVSFISQKRFGGQDDLIVKSCASGYVSVSGINVVNSGLGQFGITILSNETSGLEYGNYSYQLTRTDSGARTVLVQGYIEVNP